MKHFVTLFPPAKNVHLIKDVGQIPYHMHAHFGYTSTLVCHRNSSDYTYLNKEVEGLNIEFIEDTGATLFWENGAMRYLLKNSRSIDVLNLYHLTQASMLYGLIFKWLNPKGTLYLKLDFNLNRYQKEGLHFSDHPLKEKLHHLLYRIFSQKVDLISVETREAQRLLQEREPRLKDKLFYLPNGVDGKLIEDAKRSAAEKENIILTVGRIGGPQKNHQLLLKALSKVNLETWRVLFVGPVTKSFRSVIHNYYQQYPQLQEQVLFTGNVTDRKKLYGYYRCAKVFCLPSKSEGFPLVLAEALQFGNYIIGTDTTTSIKEMTDEGRLGRIIPPDDAEVLSKVLKEVTAPGFYTSPLKNEICTYAKKYCWETILEKLDHQLNKREDKNE